MRRHLFSYADQPFFAVHVCLHDRQRKRFVSLGCAAGKHTSYVFRITSNHPPIGEHGTIRRGSALLQIPQAHEVDAVSFRNALGLWLDPILCLDSDHTWIKTTAAA